MIGTIDVEIQAANPSMPLYPVRAYVNSPTSVRLRNVPKRVGNWNLNSVQIVAVYPDNTIKSANCVLVGNVWVGTIDGCSVSGTTENGFTVFASGIDENGNEVNNYVLGKSLIQILEADGTIHPDASFHYVHLLDEQPTTPKEGDMWPDEEGGFVIYQNGSTHGLDDNAMQLAHEAYDIATNALGGVSDIQVLIPAQASDSNQLADKAFVNSSVQTATANFRGNWSTWADVPIEVLGYPTDYTGSRTPTVNDYLVVQDASGYVGETLEGTWRFKYSGTWETSGKSGWLPEYQVNETPLTSAQLAALNSNITAAKVAQYDAALANANYALHTATMPAPYIPSNMYPITYEASDMTFTINESDWGSSLNVSDVGTNYILIHHNPTFDVDINLCYIAYSGKYSGDGDINTTKFNGVRPTANVTQVLTIAAGYELEDRAVNTIYVDPSKYTCPLVFPTLITNHARDFIVRIYAYAGNYTPTMSVSGVTLMNAEGEMPEIKTDTSNPCTTLIYFSEIAANKFLVKGESLEVITI